jgi:hypothetical protein
MMRRSTENPINQRTVDMDGSHEVHNFVSADDHSTAAELVPPFLVVRSYLLD